MSDAKQPIVLSTDWQTPTHGDFARYVEQLTGGQARVTLDEPGRITRISERTHAGRLASRPPRPGVLATAEVGPQSTAAVESSNAASHRPSNSAEIRESVAVGLRAAQWGLLLITVVQVGLLLMIGLGTTVGVAASLLAWWLVGRVKSLLKVDPSTRGARGAALAEMRRELQARVEQNRKQGNSE